MAIARDELTGSVAIAPVVRNRGGAIWRWVALAIVVVSALAAGFAVTAPDAAARAAARTGAELAQILRLMTLLKAMLAAVLAAAIAWRFAAPLSSGRLILYLASAATMIAGIGPMWDIAHLIVGATLLHAGLIASAILLWRDPAVTQR